MTATLVGKQKNVYEQSWKWSGCMEAAGEGEDRAVHIHNCILLCFLLASFHIC